MKKRTKIRATLRNAQKRGVVMDPKELASCVGKIRYTSYEDARSHNALKDYAVNPYKCKFCPNYHVGRKRNRG